MTLRRGRRPVYPQRNYHARPVPTLAQRAFHSAIGSRNRFMVNSIFLDWIWRPALDLGLVPILRVALKVFLCQLPGKGDVTGELFADEGVFQWSNLSRGVAVGWCGRRCRAIGVL
jgi:hypothetical protein